MLKKIFASLALSLATATAAFAETKVGFIYVGPIGDLGWTYRHDVGRLAVEEAYGPDVSTSYLEMVPEGPEAVQAITQLAETGHDIIFTTSFGYMDATNEVAANYPDVAFEHATGYVRETDNMATFSARFYEGRVVQGMIAANMTETNKIGYIASFPIPEVIRGINAFMLEAQKHNPDIEVDIIWLYTWFDPAKEATAAQALIDEGADIIVQHTDSPAPVQIAEQNGVYAFGQASNMSRFGPNAHLVSIVDDWDSYYVDRVGQVMDGTWTGGDTWWGFTKDGQGGEELVEAAKALEASLANGERHAFPCEGLLKQDGTVPEDCAGGADNLGDWPTLLSMNWYVAGIDASVPN
jgi:simple sugar transport system substrate-binding protein